MNSEVKANVWYNAVFTDTGNFVLIKIDTASKALKVYKPYGKPFHGRREWDMKDSPEIDKIKILGPA